MEERVGDGAVVNLNESAVEVLNRISDESESPLGVPVIQNANLFCTAVIHLLEVFHLIAARVAARVCLIVC